MLRYVVVLLFLASSLFSQTAPSGKGKLSAIIDEEWQFELRTRPEFATYIGDPRYNAEVSDLSPAAIARNVTAMQQFVARLEPIDAQKLSAAEQLNRALLLRRLNDRIDEARFKPWEMPIDQMNGIHSEWAQLPSGTTFKTSKDYTDYVTRLSKIPTLVDQVIANMHQGVKDGLVPPQFLMQQVVVQLKPIAQAPPKKLHSPARSIASPKTSPIPSNSRSARKFWPPSPTA